MTLAAVEHWNAVTADVFARAPYRRLADPRERVLGYIDLRRRLLRGSASDYACFLGTLVQEVHASHPQLRAACADGIGRHGKALAHDIAAAEALHAPAAAWRPGRLAQYIQAALQGAFVLAKAEGSTAAAGHCIAHLRQHVANLLGADAAPAAMKRSRP